MVSVGVSFFRDTTTAGRYQVAEKTVVANGARLADVSSNGVNAATLNSLVNDGMVTKLATVENGRDKVFYTITDVGKEYLKKWLALPVTKDELRYETLLKVFFGDETGSSVTLEHILNFEAKIKGDLPYLKGAVNKLTEILDDEEAHKYFLLTSMFGEKVYEAYLEWCEYAKKILGED